MEAMFLLTQCTINVLNKYSIRDELRSFVVLLARFNNAGACKTAPLVITDAIKSSVGRNESCYAR